MWLLMVSGETTHDAAGRVGPLPEVRLTVERVDMVRELPAHPFRGGRFQIIDQRGNVLKPGGC